MAKPQPSDAHGIIAHSIQENILIRDFSKQHLKIIYLIIRLSWGCCCKTWQYKNYKDFEAIGIYKSDVAKNLKYLKSNNVIEWIEKYSLLAFNKDYETWTVPIKSNANDLKTLVHESLKKTNEVSNLLTMLVKNSNSVSKKQTESFVIHEQSEAEVPSIDLDIDMPKERVKKDIKYIDHNDFFERIWKLYPNKKGKSKVSDKQKKILYKVGLDQLTRCIERYKEDKEDWKAWQHGSTFLNGGYIDYLDSNYEERENQIDKELDRRLVWSK